MEKRTRIKSFAKRYAMGVVFVLLMYACNNNTPQETYESPPILGKEPIDTTNWCDISHPLFDCKIPPYWQVKSVHDVYVRISNRFNLSIELSNPSIYIANAFVPVLKDDNIDKIYDGKDSIPRVLSGRSTQSYYDMNYYYINPAYFYTLDSIGIPYDSVNHGGGVTFILKNAKYTKDGNEYSPIITFGLAPGSKITAAESDTLVTFFNTIRPKEYDPTKVKNAWLDSIAYISTHIFDSMRIPAVYTGYGVKYVDTLTQRELQVVHIESCR
ncbi:MAG: hypothetical protein JJT94_01360 [Bernardetiaceae bacterium]|nr:hypothetical protein [Bernardetiaceae bacterium]